jgi:hypothetical protein
MSYPIPTVTRSLVRRPRIVGDAIILGQATVLARQGIENGCWCIRRPDDAVLAALLSVAYGRRIGVNDREFRAVVDASDMMPRNPARAAERLNTLPAPPRRGRPSVWPWPIPY